MNILIHFLGVELVHRLGWTLFHFLWQGTLVAGCYMLARVACRLARPEVRYGLGCATLLLMATAPVVTFFVLESRIMGVPVRATPFTEPATKIESSAVPPASAPHASLNTLEATPIQSTATPHFGGDTVLPWLVMVWLIGVGTLSARLLGGAWYIRRLRTALHHPADFTCLALLQKLQRKLNSNRSVRLFVSALVEVPTVIGWLRPVILLPATTLSGLTPPQLEAILAHELGHILRHDYLINLLQNGIETVLFYHPAVWWVSRSIRNEREHCCDDIAVAACGDRLDYARALSVLEKLRAASVTLACGAADGNLLARIRRLLGSSQLQPPTYWSKAGGLLLLGAILTVGLAAIWTQNSPAASAATTTANDATIQPAPEVPAHSYTVQFTAEGRYRLDGKDLPLEQVTRILIQDPLRSSNAVVILASKDVPYQKVAGFVEKLSTAGINRVTLKTIEPSRPNASPARQRILSKLDRIHLDEVSWDGLPLTEVIKQMQDQSRRRDPEKQGINFIVNSPAEAVEPWLATIAPAAGLPGTPEPLDVGATIIKLSLHDVTLHQLLEAITKVADQPIKYSVEDYGIIFTGKTKVDPASALHTRWFRTTDSFWQAVTNTVLPEEELDNTATLEAKEFAQLRYLLGASGIDVAPPKNVFYKRGKGMLMIRAELQEIDALEALIEGTNASDPIPAPSSVALSQQRERIDTLRQKYTDAHPLLQAELEKLKALETKVQAGATPARAEERSRFEVRLIRETPSASTTRMPLAPYLGATTEAAPEILNVDNQPLLDVAALALATVESEEKPGFSRIQLFLTAEGRSRFASITKDHIGDRLGILLEGRLVSSPRIRGEIADGTAAITGHFSKTEAKALVARLNRFVISDPVIFTLRHDGDLQFQGLSLADPKLRDSIFQTISGLGVMASLQFSSPVTNQQKASCRDVMQAMAENGLALLRSDLTNDK